MHKGTRQECVGGYEEDATFPDYEGFHDWLNNESKLETFVSALGELGIWGDTPISLMYKFEEVGRLLPQAKFVLWPRDSGDYVKSFQDFFCNYHEKAIETGERMFELHYGVCDPCDLPAKNPDEIAKRMALVRKAYENHISSVRAHFADPSRSSKFLELDLIDDQLAGRKMCEFVYNGTDADVSARCAHLTNIPPVSGNNVDPKMHLEACDILNQKGFNVHPPNYELHHSPNYEDMINYKESRRS